MTVSDWYVMPRGYTARYEACGYGVYWHLYRRGERVNGGLCDGMQDAHMEALRHSYQHQHHAEGIVTQLDDDLLMALWRSRRQPLERHA